MLYHRLGILSGSLMRVFCGRDKATEVQIIRNADSFRALEPEWTELHGIACPTHYFQSFEYLWRAWEHCASARGHELRIVVLREYGKAVAILPFVLAGPYLDFLASDKFEYRDAIVLASNRTDDWLDVAIKVSRRLGASALLLRDIRVDSAIYGYFQRRNKGQKLHGEGPAWILPLDHFDTWESYTASVNEGTVQAPLRNQRKQWRRLAKEQAPVHFTILDDADLVSQTLRWLIDQKVEWLKARGEDPRVFGSARYRAFIDAISLDALSKGHLWLATLSTGEELMAASLGFNCVSNFIWHTFAYDPKWERYSPGRLIMEKTIQWAHENKVKNFDMLVSGEAYKAQWGAKPVGVLNYLVPLTIGGRLLQIWHSMNPARLSEMPIYRVAKMAIPRRLRAAISRRLYASSPLFSKPSGRD